MHPTDLPDWLLFALAVAVAGFAWIVGTWLGGKVVK